MNRTRFWLMVGFGVLLLRGALEESGDALRIMVGYLQASPFHFLGTGLAMAAGMHLWTVIQFAVATGALCVIGAGAVRWTGLRVERTIVSVCVFFPAGYAALAMLLLGLLLVRLWFPFVLWLVWCLAVLALWRGNATWVWSTAGAFRGRVSPVVVAGLVSLALFLPAIFTPSLHSDIYEYSLAGPYTWLRAHGFYARNVVSALHYPFLAELPYAFAVMVGDEIVPKLWNLTWLFCGMGLLCSLENAGGRGWGLVGLAACGTMAAVIGSGKNDSVAIGQILLCLGSMMRAGVPVRRWGWLCASGVFAGVACSTKYVAPANLLWVPLVILLLNDGRWRWWLPVWGGVAVLVGGAWYVKSWLATGDPLWPVLAGYNPSMIEGWDGRNGEVWTKWAGLAGPSASSLIQALNHLRSDNVAFFWMLPVFLLYRGGVNSLRKWAAVGALISFLALFAVLHSAQAARWFFPSLAPAVLLVFIHASKALASVDGREGGALRAVLVVFLLCATLGRAARQTRGPDVLPCFAGAQTRDELRAEVLGSNEDVLCYLYQDPPSGAILGVGEIRSYRMPFPFIVATTINSAETPLMWKLVNGSRTERDVRKKLRQLDVDLILHNPVRGIGAAYLFSPFEWTDRMALLLERFFDRWADHVYTSQSADQRNGVFYVYRLRDAPRERDQTLLLTLPGGEDFFSGIVGNRAFTGSRGGLDEIRAIVERHGRVMQFRNVAGHAYSQMGMPGEALEMYRESAAAGVYDDVSVFNHGWSAYQLGRYVEAVKAFKSAVEIHPDLRMSALEYLHASRLSVASALARRGELEEAVAVVEEGLTDPSGAGVSSGTARDAREIQLRAALAVLHAMMGRSDAEVEFRKISAGTPEMARMSLMEAKRELLERTSPVR